MGKLRYVNGAPGAPKAVGPYSQACGVGEIVFLAGQIGLDPETGELREGFAAQAKQCFLNLQAVCEHAGSDIRELLKLNVYVTDVANFAEFNEIAQLFFAEPYPARALVGVGALPKGAVVEIEGILHVPAPPA